MCHIDSGVWADYVMYPEAPPAIRLVNDRGWYTVIVSNQKSIADGHGTLAEAETRMGKITDELRGLGAIVDASYICPHCDEDGCSCRKPKTELYEKAARDLGIDLAASWVVGDLWRDVAAGHALGARTAQVFTSHRAETKAPDAYSGIAPDVVAPNVFEAIAAIISRVDG